MKQRGRLTIFFSYADGVGKTRAMLRAASAQRRRGRSVLLGNMRGGEGLCGEAEALPCLSLRALRAGPGAEGLEFDLDAALESRPQVLVLRDLAHSNLGGCRHEKRYQDVQELLRAGIDVYTTLNVGQLESTREAVGALTGREETDWIPDAVFDAA